MNTSETFNGSTEPANAEIGVDQLHLVDIDDLMAMSDDERGRFLSLLSVAQVQELWKRRSELDEGLFHLMIESAVDLSSGSDEDDVTCPFTGLKADATVSGWYGSTWMDRMDHSVLLINSSIAKELVDLAQQVGAGVESLTIENEQETLFNSGCSDLYQDRERGFVNNIGALNGASTFDELDAQEREAVLTDEAKELIHATVNEVLKACPDKHMATRIIRDEVEALMQQ